MAEYPMLRATSFHLFALLTWQVFQKQMRQREGTTYCSEPIELVHLLAEEPQIELTVVDSRNDDGRRAMRGVITVKLFQEIELCPRRRLDLVESLYAGLEAEGLRREVMSPTASKKRNLSYFSVGNEGHLPCLRRYDLADAILFGLGTDGAEVSHRVDEFLGGGIESRRIIDFKRTLFLCRLEHARYTRPDGVHFEFLCNVDRRNAEIGVATGVFVLVGRTSIF